MQEMYERTLCAMKEMYERTEGDRPRGGLSQEQSTTGINHKHHPQGNKSASHLLEA